MIRRLVIACIATLLAFFATEVFLRFRQHAVSAKESIDQSLFQYDAELGWRLSPLARGRHAGEDYDVTYAIDADGFRLEPAPPAAGSDRAVVLGDSFTFGFGVAEDQTFVHLLNAAPGRHPAWINAAVPGYSTDQEILLLEQNVSAWKPRHVVVVVCLINDLLDNAFPFPLQAPTAKPYFELAGSGLVLRNTPVPQSAKRGADATRDLASVVAGGHLSWWRSSRLLSAGADAVGFCGGVQDFHPYVDLFQALALCLRDDCSKNGADLTLVLMPGRSLVEKPHSGSAKYQAELRRKLVALEQGAGIRVIDLEPTLRMEFVKGGSKLFFPRDGHLNALGHRAVASALRQALWPTGAVGPE